MCWNYRFPADSRLDGFPGRQALVLDFAQCSLPNVVILLALLATMIMTAHCSGLGLTIEDDSS
jgi:hypothetical protein